jgi:hypothetical protein
MPAKNALSIYNDLRLAIARIQKEGLEAQKTIENFANKFKLQGIIAGNEFASGIKKSFGEVEKSTVKLGKNIDKNFPEQLNLLNEGKKMIQNAGGALNDFFKSDEKLTKRISNLKSSLEKSFSAATPEANSFMDIVDKMKTISLQEFTDGKELADNIKTAFGDVKSAKDALKNIAPELNGNWFANFLGLDEETLNDNIMKAEEIAGSVLSKISDLIRQNAEEQMAIIDKALESTLSSIEEARKAELNAAGFAVENNNENLEAQLEAAKRTGDEILIYQFERRAEEQRINDEYDAKAQAAEEAAANEKAKIQYEVAKQEHALKLINAITEGAMAVAKALSSAPPPFNFVLAGLSGAAAAVQISMIANNPPTMPHFANSGIVPGNKFFGDRNIAAVDSGELILNRAHQDNIAGQLIADGTITATIVILLDGKELGQTTFDLANKGHYTLKTRAIQG